MIYDCEGCGKRRASFYMELPILGNPTIRLCKEHLNKIKIECDRDEDEMGLRERQAQNVLNEITQLRNKMEESYSEIGYLVEKIEILEREIEKLRQKNHRKSWF